MDLGCVFEMLVFDPGRREGFYLCVYMHTYIDKFYGDV